MDSGKSFNKYQFEANNLVRSTAEEIIEDCAKLDIVVEPNVVLLAVHLFRLDPKYCINDGGAAVNHKSTDMLVRKCIPIFSGRFCADIC